MSDPYPKIQTDPVLGLIVPGCCCMAYTFDVSTSSYEVLNPGMRLQSESNMMGMNQSENMMRNESSCSIHTLECCHDSSSIACSKQHWDSSLI